MPLDPSIPLGARVAQIQSPTEALGQIAQLQQMREQTEARRLAAEEARAKALEAKAARDQAKQQDQALVALFQTTPQPTAAQLMAVLGPERGVKLAEGMTALAKFESQQVTDAKTDAGALAAGVAALSPPMQAAVWPRVRQAVIRGGFGDAQTIPETVTPEMLTAVQRWAGVGAAAPDMMNVPVGGVIFDPVTRQPVFTNTRQAPTANPPNFQQKEATVTLPDGSTFTGLVGYNPEGNVYAPIGSTTPFPKGTKVVEAPKPPTTVDPTLAAIRDATLANLQRGGQWTPGQLASFEKLTADYDRSPLVKAADRTILLQDAVQQIRKDPTNPVNQMSLAYGFIQIADTYQSAVREGELGNIAALATRLEQLRIEANRIYSTGAFMPAGLAQQIATTSEQMIRAIDAGRQQKQQQFRSRAVVSGIGDMWDQYVAGFASPPSEDGAPPPPGARPTVRPPTTGGSRRPVGPNPFERKK